MDTAFFRCVCGSFTVFRLDDIFVFPDWRLLLHYRVNRLIDLYPHNQTAYQAVLEHLEDTGKACVVHPTGTGKSFIAFKWAEDVPEGRFIWLSPSENIFRTQLENLKRSSGFEPRNITFLSYKRLMLLTDEEMEALKPTHIVIDEFHRAGALRWGENVRKLLAVFPQAQVLGLSATPIRYLDDQRDMADELFDGCVADTMTLGAAIAQGILPAPKYVVSMYSYELEWEKYRTRIHHSSAAVRQKAEILLERLRRALENAEGLDKIFARHMHKGKYIAFCANAEHMKEMRQKAEEWFRAVDPDAHFYSVWTGSDTRSADYAAFKSDDSEHLRLLFCIDMFNEGIHVEDIDGVLLFRPTVSPIIYKQQIGRALSAMGTGVPLIVDVVNNFENLYSISGIQEEMQEFIQFYRNGRREDDIAADAFEIIDEVRDCRQLFEALEETLSLSWEAMYREAKRYYDEYGDLKVPKRYRTPDNIPLGQWIVHQRGARNGSNGMVISEHRIQLLDAIGMIWENPKEVARNEGLEHAVAFWKANGSLDVPSSYVSEDGYRLGRWLSGARAAYRAKKDAGLDPRTVPHLKQLDDMGLVWNVIDTAFEEGLAHAREYRLTHDVLDPPRNAVMDDGYQIGKWINSMRQRYKRTGHNSPLSDAQIAALDHLNIVWEGTAEQKWERSYAEAKRYFQLHGHLTVPHDLVQNGIQLWRFLNNQQNLYRKGRLSAENVRRLEEIGIRWTTRNKAWDESYACAYAYYQANGNLEIPQDFVTDNGTWLGRWVSTQRQAQKHGKLSSIQKQRLDAIAMRWEDASELRWRRNFEAAIGFPRRKNGMPSIPANVLTEDGGKLSVWLANQNRWYKLGKMSEAHKVLWEGLKR